MSLPYKPLSFHNNIPQFDLYDVTMYGKPEIWGFDEDYLVLDNFEVSRAFVPDWQMERDGKLIPIHRYCRNSRFKSIIKQLLCGSRINIKDSEMLYVVGVLYDSDPENVWNSVRSILKQNGWVNYYNRIPCILNSVGYDKKIIHPKWVIYNDILEDFQKMSWLFDNSEKYLLKRKYFMNLRFVAIKLLKKHGVVFEYKVPNLRTAKIEVELDLIFEELFSDILNSDLYQK